MRTAAFCGLALVFALSWSPAARSTSVVRAAEPSSGNSKTVTNGVGMPLVLIPAGEFQMGSADGEEYERPVHRVRITKPFYLGRTEVTQKQWRAVMGTSPWIDANARIGDDLPASELNWDDATEFCKKLGAKEGKTYRLPTEAEWEYACRAGTTTRFSFGDDEAKLGDYAWYRTNATDAKEDFPHRVAQKLPNPWGLYDMHGNMLEWCGDWFAERYVATAGDAIDPQGPASGNSYRVMRGGCWYAPPGACRSAFRFTDPQTFRNRDHGLRVVLAP